MYREVPSSVGPAVRCVWERTAERPDDPLVVPDGCVDLVWYDDGRLEVAGPDTTGRRVALRRGTWIVGVRLAPGLAPALLGLPAHELRDSQVDLADVAPGWRRIAETSAPDRVALECEVDRVLRRVDVDHAMAAAVAVLARRPTTRVRDVAAELGLSTRQLGRRFGAAVGYGPKTYARVARMERFVGVLAADPGADLAASALTAGYASQSHLSDEVRDLTTLTPVRFLEDRGLRAS